jgi:RNA polymerase sigma-70 factor (ECF subfamily)
MQLLVSIPMTLSALFQVGDWVELVLRAVGGTDSEALPEEFADEEQALMAKLAEGDGSALRPIFDRWKLPLISYFYRSLGSHADSEDLTLRTFERVYRAAPRYRPEGKFSTWLFAIARHELLHELRRRKRKPVEALPPEDLNFAVSDGAQLDRIKALETEEHLLSHLQELPEKQRSALLLSSAGELSHSEIAQTLGVSENNLHVILHRARLALRSLLKGKDENS